MLFSHCPSAAARASRIGALLVLLALLALAGCDHPAPVTYSRQIDLYKEQFRPSPAPAATHAIALALPSSSIPSSSSSLLYVLLMSFPSSVYPCESVANPQIFVQSVKSISQSVCRSGTNILIVHWCCYDDVLKELLPLLFLLSIFFFSYRTSFAYASSFLLSYRFFPSILQGFFILSIFFL